MHASRFDRSILSRGRNSGPVQVRKWTNEFFFFFFIATLPYDLLMESALRVLWCVYSLLIAVPSGTGSSETERFAGS